ncbi:porin family protein [Novosphingobium sp. NBM11]|uniref:outer membrane protein n=1 Tax=unclassified Novosphingobium TaxID=2644732 RepID=UPI00061C7FBE|nr:MULTISPECIES: porin family protein [unclassified Novosphingobium]MBF5090069.1 porin family protein [Novosphingobium sp. NBM11]ODU69022.1 MAG: hypothetical protein ABT11_14100 [Novosphingobium sp. SCN 66-18]GAO54056.1 outer membrane protein [Novosphingobium sp. MD-1]
MRTFLVSAAASALAIGLAAPASAEPFNGPFVGVQAGWNQDKIGGINTDVGAVGVNGKKDSFELGGFIGYDHKINPKVVVGAEAGINWGIQDNVYGPGVTIDPKRSIDLTVRAGYLVNDKTLVYARGGYSSIRARTYLANANAGEDRDAWVVGGGVERSLTPHFSTRLEYRYNDASQGTGKWDRHQVLAGVAYRF